MPEQTNKDNGPNTDGFSVLQQETKVRTVDPGVHILGGMGNCLAIETDLGFVQMDTGINEQMAVGFLETLRTISDAPVHTIVYSHGHSGFNHGAREFLKAARERGEPEPQIIAHENLPKRYRRFTDTWELQNYLAAIQFRFPVEFLPKPEYQFPTITFSDILRLKLGNRTIEIIWAPSETDDAIAIWLPDDRILCGGPASIPACINIGTPLRTQRDDVRWANTLDKMIALRPEVLIPCHGDPVEGYDQIEEMLGNMAEGLRYLRREVVKRLNQGMTDVEILHDITYPAEYFERPWSAPVYGCPDMIVRDIYRSENGWWDRNPTSLHPAAPTQAANTVAESIADKKTVLKKARALRDAGKIQLALHVTDVLALATVDDPDVKEAKRLKSELCHLRSKEVPSIISVNLYLSHADSIDKQLA